MMWQYSPIILQSSDSITEGLDGGGEGGRYSRFNKNLAHYLSH